MKKKIVMDKIDFPINDHKRVKEFPKYALTDELKDKKAPWWK